MRSTPLSFGHLPILKSKNGEKAARHDTSKKILWNELRGNKLGVHFNPLRPSGTSLTVRAASNATAVRDGKSNDVNFESAFRLFLVVFGGSRSIPEAKGSGRTGGGTGFA